MAITLYGVDPSIDEAHWSRLLAILGRCSGDEMVDTGLVPSPAGTNRAISVTAGNAVAAGVLAESSSSATLNLDTNVGANPRIDYIVLQVDWTGTTTTGGTIRFVKGTNAVNPVPPTLTQTAGTLWQIPLARVTVTPSVTTIPAGDVEVCRPLARKAIAYTSALSTTSVVHTNADVVRATIEVTDPGWPYTIVGAAILDPVASSSGRCTLEVKIDGANLTTGYTVDKNAGPGVAPARGSTTITGASTVTAELTPTNMSTDLGISSGRLNVVVHHA